MVCFSMVSAVLGCGNAGGTKGNGGQGDSCSDSSECGDLEFCNAGSCDEVAGRSFFVSAKRGTAVSNGDWDTGGGAPDPFVTIFLDGDPQCYTSTQEDTFQPEWGEGCDVVFESGGEIELDMYDEDVSENDVMLYYVASGTDDLVSLARGGTQTVSNDSASLTIAVTPNF
jgi:hypothetical protein